ncbi:hypothetical protein DSOUD_0667 [Desulfuromonas soudanensis]|uniref:Tetratricopeptide repeat protein n=1 Tax=Desulfuromonas soudanensis TaxID=1603606 RepID=A0A0M4D7I1_9BACT|nr:SGNH/GDSL hydrolase family protein [Desulfuromonas soudanensis]ALC15455.1 hypothetical protein DSOUD_0667 [Desulfuromonas soudanensis]
MKNILYNLLAVVTGLALLALIEGVLTLGGVAPLANEDPFIGFSGSAPLFIEAEPGRLVLNPVKEHYFNSPQSFQEPKPKRTFRIVALGGSTTYGRPYLGQTSFVAWLTQLLGRYDSSHRYEPLNLGGISYASYRVARVAEEMAGYEPDLFVLYAGHNEFLEARTFAGQKSELPLLRKVRGVFHHSRLYSLLFRMLPKGQAAGEDAAKTVLGDEVAAKLEQVGGTDLYHRDADFRRGVIAQYRYSMAGIIDRARQRHIPVILCTLPSNLAGMSPFKSEHRPGLLLDEQKRFAKLLQQAAENLNSGSASEALVELSEAEALDDSYALLHFFKGAALEKLGRYPEAYRAYLRAKEEDVVPLRALEVFNQVIRELAQEKQVPLADVEAAIRGASEHGIPGNTWFDDHVHPTIAGQQLIAWEVLDAATRAGVVPLSREQWLASREDADRSMRQSLRELPADYIALGEWGVGRLFFWAGKYDEAYPALLRAWLTIRNVGEIPRQIAAIEYMRGDYGLAYQRLQDATQIDSDEPQVRLLLAQVLAAQQRTGEALDVLARVPEEKVAPAQLLLVRGEVELMSGLYDEAMVTLARAVELAPEAAAVHLALAKAHRGHGDLLQAEQEYRVYLQLSGAPFTEAELAVWLKGG